MRTLSIGITVPGLRVSPDSRSMRKGRVKRTLDLRLNGQKTQIMKASALCSDYCRLSRDYRSWSATLKRSGAFINPSSGPWDDNSLICSVEIWAKTESMLDVWTIFNNRFINWLDYRALRCAQRTNKESLSAMTPQYSCDEPESSVILQTSYCEDYIDYRGTQSNPICYGIFVPGQHRTMETWS